MSNPAYVCHCKAKANKEQTKNCKEKNWTRLHLAADNGHARCLAKLEGSNLSCDLSGNTPLHLAVKKGHHGISLHALIRDYCLIFVCIGF